MSNFTIIKASKKSVANRKLVFGVGVNDADYIVRPTINGIKVICPYYGVWFNMLKRCYYSKSQVRSPTYIGCTVCDEWIVFSNFREWMVAQDWEGMELDKDIKIKGNKVYSPDMCMFIPSQLNTLFLDNASTRGLYPVGVNYDKYSDNFKAQITINGKIKHLGRFKTVEEASNSYQKARKEKIMNIIKNNIYANATQYLEQHI